MRDTQPRQTSFGRRSTWLSAAATCVVFLCVSKGVEDVEDVEDVEVYLTSKPYRRPSLQKGETTTPYIALYADEGRTKGSERVNVGEREKTQKSRSTLACIRHYAA